MMSYLRTGILTVVTLMLAACSGESDESAQRNAQATGGAGQPAAQERKPVPGVDWDRKVIRLGALNGESGPAGVIGKPYAVGKRVLVAHINSGQSGLLPDGWKIELVERDHGYNPQRSVQMFNEIRDDILFLITSFGTPNTLPLRPMLERHQIVAFPASFSSKMAEFKYTPPFGPSYTFEAMRAMDYVVASAEDPASIRAGVIYQQDDYGKDGLDGWRKAAAHHGVTVVAEETYAPGQADYTAAVSALKQAGATHVMLSTLPSATGPILGAAAQLDYAPQWFGNTPSWIDRFFDPNVIPASIFTNFHLITGLPYWGEPSATMDRFLQLYDQHGKDQSPPDTYIWGSYIQGLQAIEALRRAIEADDLSRAGYVKALQSMKNFTIPGVPYGFNMAKVPYVVGDKTRVLAPDMANGSWQVVAPPAAPAGI